LTVAKRQRYEYCILTVPRYCVFLAYSPWRLLHETPGRRNRPEGDHSSPSSAAWEDIFGAAISLLPTIEALNCDLRREQTRVLKREAWLCKGCLRPSSDLHEVAGRLLRVSLVFSEKAYLAPYSLTNTRIFIRLAQVALVRFSTRCIWRTPIQIHKAAQEESPSC
jgi:hypothetical protein